MVGSQQNQQRWLIKISSILNICWQMETLLKLGLRAHTAQIAKLLLQISHLFERSECSQSQVLLHTIRSQHQRSGEVGSLGDIRLDVGALNHSLPTIHTLDQTVCEPGCSVGHGESGTASTILSLDNLSS